MLFLDLVVLARLVLVVGLKLFEQDQVVAFDEALEAHAEFWFEADRVVEHRKERHVDCFEALQSGLVVCNRVENLALVAGQVGFHTGEVDNIPQQFPLLTKARVHFFNNLFGLFKLLVFEVFKVAYVFGLKLLN